MSNMKQCPTWYDIRYFGGTIQSLTGAPQTAHFRLLNAFAKAAYDLNLPNEHELSAHKLHEDLFLSGFERILLVPFFPPLFPIL